MRIVSNSRAQRFEQDAEAAFAIGQGDQLDLRAGELARCRESATSVRSAVGDDEVRRVARRRRRR